MTSGPRFRSNLVRTAIVLFLVLLHIWIIAALVHAAADQKLILRDGTDHRVRSYEVKGDRVRYYSLEREEWEEIPSSMVDWEATEAARKEAEKPPEIELEEAPRPFEVAPGLPLPDQEGVFAFDGKNLLLLSQSHATVQNDTKRRILGAVVPVPIVKGRAWMLIEGPIAKITVAGSNPVFYVKFREPSPSGYGVVRLRKKDANRIVGEIQIHPITAQQSETRDVVPTAVEPVRAATDDGQPGVLRLTPLKPLVAGEYAVVEFVKKDQANLFVWDFSFKPAPQAQPAR